MSGINISGPNGKVYGSYIGVNAAGMAAAPNASDGITVDGMNATIGGIGTNERNVISGNSDNGVFICVCANATIVGNYIGTDKNGTLPVGNDTWGVQILNAQNVTVGGTIAAERNVISGQCQRRRVCAWFVGGERQNSR